MGPCPETAVSNSTIDDWIEWKQMCDSARCSEDVRHRLWEWAGIQLNAHLRKWGAGQKLTEFGEWNEDPERAWHLFESHMVLKQVIGAKKPKDWLFDRLESGSGSPLDIIQGGGSLILRDVAKDLIRKNYSPPNWASLDAPVTPAAESSLTLGDLLPDAVNPADEAAFNELTELAEAHAQELFSSMSRRQRVALMAKGLGISLAETTLLETVDCSKSTLYDALAAVKKELVDRIEHESGESDSESLQILAALTLQALEILCLRWAESENDLSRYF